MTVEGTVRHVLEPVSGEGKKGRWEKQDYVIETGGEYPKMVAVTLWNDTITEADLQEGCEATFHIDIQSREYNGRWYTDVKAWKVEVTARPEAPEAPDVPVDDELPF